VRPAGVVETLDGPLQLLEPPLGDGATDAGIGVLGVCRECAVVAEVPQVGVVEGEAQRVTISPGHHPEGAVAKREAVMPLRGRPMVGEAVACGISAG